jgi:hypothetical protein
VLFEDYPSRKHPALKIPETLVSQSWGALDPFLAIEFTDSLLVHTHSLIHSSVGRDSGSFPQTTYFPLSTRALPNQFPKESQKSLKGRRPKL